MGIELRNKDVRDLLAMAQGMILAQPMDEARQSPVQQVMIALGIARDHFDRQPADDIALDTTRRT